MANTPSRCFRKSDSRPIRVEWPERTCGICACWRELGPTLLRDASFQLFSGAPVKFSSIALDQHFSKVYLIQVLNRHFTSRLLLERGVLRHGVQFL